MSPSHYKYTYAPLFKSRFKKYDKDDKEAIEKAILAIKDYKKTKKAPYGLRIKRLSRKIYKARVDISLRILFFSDKNMLRFVCVGNHDEIIRALKKIDKLIF